MSEQVDPRVPPMPSEMQEAVVVTPEILLGQIVNVVGQEFVVIPTQGWVDIVKTITESSDEGLADRCQALKVPVIPVSLSPKEPDSPIITPDNMPRGESKIILP